ncbi:MAG: hypothetical protein WCK31_00670 [bacterium]
MNIKVIIKKYIKTILINRATSLLELLITLGIMIILLTMISNVFVEVMRINIINKERTFVREESAIVLAQIKKDIRNADSLIECDGVNLNSGSGQASNSCTFSTGNRNYKWNFEEATGDYSAADGYVAKKYIISNDPAVDPVLIYTSSDGILFTLDASGDATSKNKVFTILSDPINQDGQLTVLIKLVAKSLPGQSEGESIVKNVIKQTIVSARNFSSN